MKNIAVNSSSILGNPMIPPHEAREKAATSERTDGDGKDTTPHNDVECRQPQLPQQPEEAFVTMLINDEFAIGAEVMLYSLRKQSKMPRPQVVLVTAEVSELKRQSLKSVTDHIIEVSVLYCTGGIVSCAGGICSVWS